ncbi:MAG: GNAT family N-acetyltransferase [Taibaiella sp.]|nr:GNAT family N-acetyltransferase [Taibaiella sp.]
MEQVEIYHVGYIITTDKAAMYPADIHHWLSTVSYWAKFMPYGVFKRSFDNSFVIGAIAGGRQVGYARLVTDYATFAYLADVYVEDSHQGKGIGKVMMRELFNLQWVKGLRRMMLATKDAHDLYRKVGFTNSKFPERIMEITRPDIYGDLETRC